MAIDAKGNEYITGSKTFIPNLDSHQGELNVSWIRAIINYKITANKQTQQYDVEISTKMTADYNMNWTGESLVYITIGSTRREFSKDSNNESIEFPLHGSGAESPSKTFVFHITPDNRDHAVFKVEIDFAAKTNCSICGAPGIGYKSQHEQGRNVHFIGIGGDFDIGMSIPALANAPKSQTLSNNNPRKANASIGMAVNNNASDSPSDITIKWVCSDNGGADLDGIAYSYRVKNANGSYGAWNNNHWLGKMVKLNGGSSGTFTINGLTAGTTYEIAVSVHNSVGFYKKSNTGNADRRDYGKITIRTRYPKPIVSSFICSSRELERLKFTWVSNYPICALHYKLDGSETWSNITVSPNSTTGTISISSEPGTRHVISNFAVLSDIAHDGVLSDEYSVSGTTMEISKIVHIDELVFGLDFSVDIEAESSNPMSLKIWTEGNNRTAEVIIIPVRTAQTFTQVISLTQEQLDDIYRTFPPANRTTMLFELTTKGSKNFTDVIKDERLLLTGIAKTAHVGINNTPRRVQVWIGDSKGVPRRAVTWVGSEDNTPHRTI